MKNTTRKDWTGNGNSVWKTLGASNHTDKERETDDFYATASEAIDKLLTVERPHNEIWECAAGAGHLSKRLRNFGYDVYSTDITYRGYILGALQDFLTATKDDIPFTRMFDILTNPPYKCFSSDTECYTERGWLRYNELKKTDRILSVNPYTLELEWSKINAIITKEVDEELLHFKKSHLDILCTKDHRMFAYNIATHNLSIKNGDLIKSQDIRSTHFIPRTGYYWRGKGLDKFILPAIRGYSYAQPVIKQEIEIDIKDWLEFFGLWLADGYCRHTENVFGDARKTVGIKQSIKTADKVRKILNRLPFNYKEYNDVYNRISPCINFEIHNEQLWSYLCKFGKSQNKYVPNFIKELPRELLTIFIDAYFFGDGSCYKNNGRTYRTVSKKLIEDIQEILLKLGYLSHITAHTYTKPNGEKQTLYSIWQNPDSMYNKYYYPSAKDDKCKVRYKGVVWCVNLEKNGVFLLRRNNKEFFSGNCAKEFVLHALELLPVGGKCYMFLKLTFLEGEARYKEIFSQLPPEVVYVFSKRIMCAKNGEFDKMKAGGGSAVAYAWFVWEKGYAGETLLKWI